MGTRTPGPRSAFGRLAGLTVLVVTFALVAPSLPSATAAGPQGGAAPGPGIPKPAPVNTPRGLVPRNDAAHPRGLATTANQSNPSCSDCAPPLTYSPNTPVMGGLTATPGEATITPVFWAPSGYSFPSSYKTIIDGYLTNVAAASGTNSNVFSIAQQYYQQPTGGLHQYIHYLVHAGSELDVTDPFTATDAGCIADSGFSACVDDATLQAEVHTATTTHGLVEDDAHLYLVFFPPGVETCQGTGAASGSNPCSTNIYCAYHSGFNDPVSADIAIYANQPYPDLNGCTDGINGPQAPNGDAEADAQVSLISHEASEAITDTFGAWMDAHFYENGDECSYVYGTPLGSTGVTPGPGATGTAYNQTINGGHYYTQDEFSDAEYFANVGDLVTPTYPVSVAGCLQRPYVYPTPTVTHVSPAAGPQAGVTNVTITGTNLTNILSVDFGTAHAGGWSVVSDTEIIASSPPHAAGTVDVTVSNPDHVSATTSADHFTYARSGSQPYVTTAYLDLLGRAPTASRLAYWSSNLDHGGSRTAFIANLTGSSTHVDHIITGLYQTILGRSPSAASLSGWEQKVTTKKMTTAQVAVAFYATTEYFTHAGAGNTAGWVTSLYHHILGRAPSASSLAYWVGRTASLGRTSVASQLYQSSEGRGDRVNAVYQQFLLRLPDAATRTAWAGAILTGGDDALMRHLAISTEYVNLAIIRNP